MPRRPAATSPTARSPAPSPCTAGRDVRVRGYAPSSTATGSPWRRARRESTRLRTRPASRQRRRTSVRQPATTLRRLAGNTHLHRPTREPRPSGSRATCGASGTPLVDAAAASEASSGDRRPRSTSSRPAPPCARAGRRARARRGGPTSRRARPLAGTPDLRGRERAEKRVVAGEPDPLEPPRLEVVARVEQETRPSVDDPRRAAPIAVPTTREERVAHLADRRLAGAQARHGRHDAGSVQVEVRVRRIRRHTVLSTALVTMPV